MLVWINFPNKWDRHCSKPQSTWENITASQSHWKGVKVWETFFNLFHHIDFCWNHFSVFVFTHMKLITHCIRYWLVTCSALSHYLNWCWLIVNWTSDNKFNILRPRQNGRHFADDMFKCTFVNKNVWILIEISLTFVHKGSINNNPGLF